MGLARRKDGHPEVQGKVKFLRALGEDIVGSRYPRRFCSLQDGIMLASRTHWFRAISTFILLYLLSAGVVALIVWRLPSRASLVQPGGMFLLIGSWKGLHSILCMQLWTA